MPDDQKQSSVITEEMIAKGAHVLSEWLDDMAPLNERRYRDPAKACFEAMHAMTATETGQYLIWSNQHKAWWRPNSQGYTVHLDAAGRYARDEAIAIARGSRDGWTDRTRIPSEIAIREADVLAAASEAR